MLSGWWLGLNLKPFDYKATEKDELIGHTQVKYC